MSLDQLAKEKEALQYQLENARNRDHMEVDIESVSREIVKQLSEFHDVLAHGKIAGVKAVLSAYIGRVELFPKEKRARVGFYRLPTRALCIRKSTHSKCENQLGSGDSI